MRQKIVAANWKMHTMLEEGIELVRAVLAQIEKKVETGKWVIFAPPFTHLKSVSDIVAAYERIAVAAQNCHYEPKGAYTGEISAAMLRSVGCRYVIIGHSERRRLFYESEEMILKKIEAALQAGLKVIYCCGESWEEREQGMQEKFVAAQLEGSILKLTKDQLSAVVVAYEPVWAIGTGKNATPVEAQQMHAFIRDVIAIRFGHEVAARQSIVYGGSLNAENAREIFAQPDVDGGLVGGASLQAEAFVTIVNSL